MKKIFAILMLAATVAACTVEDIKEQPEGPHTYTMTVKASKGVDTKALSLSGNTLNATWAGGETVTVKEGDTPLGTLTAYVDPEDNAKATLKGNLNPAPSASGVELTLEFNSSGGFSSQDGTLSYIESHTDYAKATTTVTIDGTNVTGTPASFVNQNAIVKFTLKDGETVLKPSKLVVTGSVSDDMMSLWETYSHGMQFPTIPNFELSISPEAQDAGFVYFATPGLTNQQLSTLNLILKFYNSTAVTVSLTAIVGDETYTYTKNGYPFEISKYYDIKVMMTKQYRSMDKATTNDIGKVIGANGKIYVNVAEAIAAGTTAEAMIAYVGAVSGVCEHGLAVELKDYSTSDNSKNTYTSFTLSEAQNYAAGKTEITGGTWRLPKDEDWQYMFTGNTATTEFNISSFQTKMGLVGNALVDGYYWTDTQITIENKIYQQIIYHSSNAASVQHSATDQYWHVRACLAF